MFVRNYNPIRPHGVRKESSTPSRGCLEYGKKKQQKREQENLKRNQRSSQLKNKLKKEGDNEITSPNTEGFSKQQNKHTPSRR